MECVKLQSSETENPGILVPSSHCSNPLDPTPRSPLRAGSCPEDFYTGIPTFAPPASIALRPIPQHLLTPGQGPQHLGTMAGPSEREPSHHQGAADTKQPHRGMEPAQGTGRWTCNLSCPQPLSMQLQPLSMQPHTHPSNDSLPPSPAHGHGSAPVPPAACSRAADPP